jgi:hypothetical protein
MTDDLIRPLRGAFPGPAIEPNSSIRDQLALLGQVGVRYGGFGLAPSLLNNLVAYWKLDETSGPRIDSAGSNNLTDNNSVGSAVGKVGNAALFDGSNYLTVTNPTLNITGAISIAGWIYAVNRTLRQHIFGGYAPLSPYSGYGVCIGPISSKYEWWSGSGGWKPSNTAIALNTWAHIAFTLNSTGTLNMYLNGSLDRTTTSSAPGLYNGQRALGARSDGTRCLVSGTLVDEVCIWKDRVLTPTEIAILYNGGAGITFPF